MHRIFIHIMSGFAMFLVLNLFVISVHSADGEYGVFDLGDYQASISNSNDYYHIQSGELMHYRHEHALGTHHHGKKMRFAKQKTVHIYITPTNDAAYTAQYYPIPHTPSLSVVYRYLYFKEINPPPPKPC